MRLCRGLSPKATVLGNFSECKNEVICLTAYHERCWCSHSPVYDLNGCDLCRHFWILDSKQCQPKFKCQWIVYWSIDQEFSRIHDFLWTKCSEICSTDSLAENSEQEWGITWLARQLVALAWQVLRVTLGIFRLIQFFFIFRWRDNQLLMQGYSTQLYIVN